MRTSLALVALLLVTASCSGQPQRDRESPGGGTSSSSASNSAEATSDLSSAPAERAGTAGAGPNVSPTAAPGVAFNYSYAFRLEAQRIAQVQEQHAALCEQLGTNRCRITGMLYRVRNESDIEARLSFKLDPAIARRFGREGVNLVTRAEGMLVESEITGTDVGTTIRQAGRSIAQMNEDLRRLEARLAGRLSQGERETLEYQAQQLRDSIRAAQENRQDAQESLATTPMTFVYGSGDLVPGFDTRRPIRDALDQAGRNFIDGAAVLFVVAVTLLPWALLALLIWLAIRFVRRRWFRASPEVAREPVDAGA
jgi:gas vesicle protein